MPRGRCLINAAAWSVFAFCILHSAFVAGCSPSAPPQRPGVREAVERLRQLHAQRRYEAMADHIVGGRAAAVVQTLVAMDRLLDANRALRARVAERIGPDIAAMIDLSYLGEHLELFSPQIRIVSEHIRGDEATVVFQVGQRVPLERARFVWRDGAWKYDPGPGYDPRLPKAFLEMARGLEKLADDVRSGRLDADRVRRDPQVLVDAMQRRLEPGLRMLPEPATQP